MPHPPHGVLPLIVLAACVPAAADDSPDDDSTPVDDDSGTPEAPTPSPDCAEAEPNGGDVFECALPDDAPGVGMRLLEDNGPLAYDLWGHFLTWGPGESLFEDEDGQIRVFEVYLSGPADEALPDLTVWPALHLVGEGDVSLAGMSYESLWVIETPPPEDRLVLAMGDSIPIDTGTYSVRTEASSCPYGPTAWCDVCAVGSPLQVIFTLPGGVSWTLGSGMAVDTACHHLRVGYAVSCIELDCSDASGEFSYWTLWTEGGPTL